MTANVAPDSAGTQGRTKTRSDRKLETRRRILDAALQLVEEGRSPQAPGLR